MLDGMTASTRPLASRLAALHEGRARLRSTLTFDVCLDRYLAALERGGAREKTIRHNRWVAKKYIQPDRFAIVVVGDQSKIEAPIRALNLGTIKTLTIDEVFGPRP